MTAAPPPLLSSGPAPCWSPAIATPDLATRPPARAWRYGAPRLALGLVAVAHLALLRLEGRRWWCACGRLTPWSGNVWSAHNSQHLLDPYSFTHILHGLLLAGLAYLLCRRWRPTWQLWLVVTIEAAWEVWENSRFIIDRYRAATMSLDYYGDSIANSAGDVLCCALGFVLARWLGFRWSVALCVVTEAVLVVWIRDSLLLNIVMLIHPVPALKAWQMGG